MPSMNPSLRPLTAPISPTSKVRGRGFARAGGSSVRALGVPSALEGIAHLHTTPAIFKRGVDLYIAGSVSSTLYPHIFHVAGEGAFYRVDLTEPDCGCEFWVRHHDARVLQVSEKGTRARGRAVACKHMIAAGAKALELAGEGVE